MGEATSRMGFGCMRLSTMGTPDESNGIAVLHAALEAGATLVDTADAYGPAIGLRGTAGETEIGHNERLIARALSAWRGDRRGIEIATKGGLTRPGGRWVPDGRAKHIRAACEASLSALGVERIDLYQLHAVDPRTPLETSVRVLAGLQKDGLARRIGLCNVTVAQIEVARRIADIASVQVSLSPFDEENFRNGVAEYCRDHGLRLIAYRPLGGARHDRPARHPVLVEIARAHDAAPHEIALAWLLDLDECVVPIPGATRLAHAASLARVAAIRLTGADRDRLDRQFPAGRLLRTARSHRRPPQTRNGDVVLVMGMPGAGKSTFAGELASQGYRRLNRDERGGRLSGLVAALDAGIGAGVRHWVLDNTYAARQSRNDVIECAWSHGLGVRCIWLRTSIGDAQVNAILRLLEVHGRLPAPEELRAIGKHDHRYFGPDAQFRYEWALEPPSMDEGFEHIEEVAFDRRAAPAGNRRALILEYDGVLAASARGDTTVLEAEDVRLPADHRAVLHGYRNSGWLLLGTAWRPQLATGMTSEARVLACFERTRQLLGFELPIAVCPHPAGPPVCWCRKPIPGSILEFLWRNQIHTDRCLMVGASAADRTLAARLSMRHHDPAAFFRG